MKHTNGKKRNSKKAFVSMSAALVAVLLVVMLAGCTNRQADTNDNDNGTRLAGERQTTEPERGGTESSTEPVGTIPIPAPEPAAAMVSYELIIGDIVITSPEYNFYFVEFMYQMFDSYFHHLGFAPFDFDIPLEDQMYLDGEQTWADYIHSFVEGLMQQYAQARASGAQLTEDDLMFLEDYMMLLQREAESSGQTIDEHIGSFYEGMTGDLFMRFIERELVTEQWRNSEMANLSFSLEEKEAFYYENWEDIDPWSNGVRNMEASTVNARHILVMFPDNHTGEDVEEALQIAEEILAEWKNGEATEDSFARLATERTDDPGSAHTGGLYSNIWRGQMVPEFDAWIFDPDRNFGDTDIVETNFGFHIMFFVRSNIDWMMRTEAALTDKAVIEIINNVSENFIVERRRV